MSDTTREAAERAVAAGPARDMETRKATYVLMATGYTAATANNVMTLPYEAIAHLMLEHARVGALLVKYCLVRVKQSYSFQKSRAVR